MGIRQTPSLLVLLRFSDKNAVRCSMSRKRNGWDNALIKCFFVSMKTELGNGVMFETRQQAKDAIFRFTETFYNRQHLHSAIGNRQSAIGNRQSAIG